MRCPKASIIILNWNGEEYLEDCLSSVSNQFYQNYEVILVDNGSTDGSITYVKENFSEVKIIELNKNCGFAKGINEGIKKILEFSDIICILPQDTVVEPTFLTECIQILDQEGVGLVSPKIKYFGTNKFWYAGGKIYKGRELLSAPTIKPTIHVGKLEEDVGQYNTLIETDYATGCALFIKKEVIEKIGLLDERYFMYFEDADWSIRASRAGYKIYYVPTTTVYHKVPHESTQVKQRFRKYVIYTKSLLKFVLKCLNVRNRILWTVKIPFALIVTIIEYVRAR